MCTVYQEWNWKGEVRQEILWPLFPFITLVKSTVTHEATQYPFRSTPDWIAEFSAVNSFISMPALVHNLNPSGLLRRLWLCFNFTSCTGQKRHNTMTILLSSICGLFSLLFYTLPTWETLCQIIKDIELSGVHMETGGSFKSQCWCW